MHLNHISKFYHWFLWKSCIQPTCLSFIVLWKPLYIIFIMVHLLGDGQDLNKQTCYIHIIQAVYAYCPFLFFYLFCLTISAILYLICFPSILLLIWYGRYEAWLSQYSVSLCLWWVNNACLIFIVYQVKF